MAGKGVVRSIKNYAKGFSEVQIKVREATSNDSSGPSGSLMNEIAQLTFNEQDFIEIMDMLDKRLNDKGKNWRHVFKALLVLDYCLHVGSENVVLYAKENIYVVRTLKEFQHIDDTGKDVGFNVRQKAKDITSLLLDENRLKEERRTRKHMQDRMAGVGDYMNDTLWSSNRSTENSGVYQHPGYMDEDKDLKRAIEESKRLAEQESKKRGEGTEDDLQRAIRESEQEARENERKKKEALERENQNNLFSNASSSTSQTFQGFAANQSFTPTLNPYGQAQQQQQQQQQWPQATGMSFSEPIQRNPYQQQPQQAFDTFSLQAQMTGMPPQMMSQQAQMTGLPQQAQMTGLPQQAQFTGNPYGLQQQMFGTPTMAYNQMSNSTSQSTPTNTQYPMLNSMLQQNNASQAYSSTTGFSNALVPQSNTQVSSMTESPSNSPAPFTQPFAQQPNRNPFGQPTSANAPSQGQKSLLEMMQEQKMQQHQLAQPGFQQLQQQPQMTNNQPMNMQPTGYQAFSQQSYGQQPPFF